MATNSKDIELVIRATDLSSKPLAEIGTAVDRLNKTIDEITPAADRGEVSLKELTAVSGKLREALKGLASNKAVIESFRNLSTQIESSKNNLTQLGERVQKARSAIASAGQPTKELARELKAAEKAFQQQESAITRYTQKLATVEASAQRAGINVRDLAGAERQLETVFQSAAPAFSRVNGLIENYGATQRKAAEAAAAAAREQQAAQEELARQAERLARAQKEAAATDLFKKQSAEAAKLVRDAEYVRFWVDALEKKEAAEREATQAAQALQLAQKNQAKDLANFQRIGTDAAAAAKNIGRLATQVDQLSVANARAGASVRSIVDPNADLGRSVSGLEKLLEAGATAAKRYADELRKTGQTTVNTRDELQKLGQVQQGAVAIATLVERLQNTRAAAAAAAREMRAARGDVLKYAQAVATATEPNEALARTLAEAQARLTAAQQRYTQFAAAAARLRTDLAASGSSTKNLSTELERLKGIAGSARTAIGALGTASEKLVTSQTALGRFGGRVLRDSGRQTLSLYQRMRGEILALAAANVGLFGAIEGTRKVLDAVRIQEGIVARLGVAFGKAQVGQELEYIREQADRLGLVLPDLSSTYSKFAIAARAAGVSLNDTRFVFESFSEVGKVFQLSTDEIGGVFKALEQVFSKGTVQAEELRGQLGDRLSGAFYEFARALNITTKDLNGWLKEGKVTSDFVLLFAKQFREKVGGEIVGASNNAASNLARLETALFDFRLAIADSGFIEAFTAAVKRLSEFLKSEDGQNFAKSIGRALTEVSKAFIFLLDNIDAVKFAIKALFASYAAGVIIRTGTAVKQTAGFVKEMAAAFVLARKRAVEFFLALTVGVQRSLAALAAIGGALAAAFAGFQLGEFLYDQSPTVRKFAAAMVATFKQVWVEIAALGKIAWARITNFSSAGFKQALDKIRKETNAEIDAIQANVTDYFVAENNPAAPGKPAKPGAKPKAATITQLDVDREKQLREALAKIREEADGDDGKAGKKAADARIRLAEEVADALRRIEDRILEEQADTLEERLALIDREYEELFAKLKELEPQGGAQTARLRGFVEQLKVIERTNFALEQQKKEVEAIKDSQSRVNDLIQVRDAQIAAENEKRRAGLQTEEQARLRIAEINNSARGNIEATAKATIAMIDALKDPAARDQLAGVRADMDAILARLIELPTRLISTDEVLNQWADGLTNVLDKFAEAIVSAGSLTEGFAAAGRAFREFASNFLREIATMILKQQILNALQSATKATRFADLFSGLTVAHTGGIIGQTHMASRAGDPSWFRNARRYHTGGMVGLRSDEVPAILQRGEEVLARSDPRNAANGGGGSGGNVKVINTIDSQSVVREGLSSKAGERVILNIIQANRAALRQALS